MLTPELLGIAAGLALSLGIFAFKAAAGEYFFCALPGSARRKIFFLLLNSVLYCAVFLLAFKLIETIDLFRLAGSAAEFLKTGVIFHLILAAGLVVWGVRLLCQRPEEELRTRAAKGWLLLTLPCPVCMAAVFLSTAFALMLFPGAAPLLRGAIPAGVLTVNALFLLLLFALGRYLKIPPLHLTGRAMIGAGLYLLLILLCAPGFQEAEKLYAVACSAGGGSPLPWSPALTLVFLGVAVLAGVIWGLSPRKGC